MAPGYGVTQDKSLQCARFGQCEVAKVMILFQIKSP